MKHYICCLFCLLLPAFTMLAQEEKNMDYWLEKLDASLDSRDRFEQARAQRIDSLRRQLLTTHDDEEGFLLAYSLYDEYRSYCYDSARHYAYDCLDRARAQERGDRIAMAQNAIAFSLISAGILSEARDVLGAISDVELVPSPVAGMTHKAIVITIKY